MSSSSQLSAHDVKQMKVAELKIALQGFGLQVNGLKAELSERLLHHVASKNTETAPGTDYFILSLHLSMF